MRMWSMTAADLMLAARWRGFFLTAQCTWFGVLQIKAALNQAGLSPGAVNIRFPERFRMGAFTNPDPILRAAAVQLAVGGCSTAVQLGSNHVVVWSPYDGYDYYLQVGAWSIGGCDKE